MMRTYIRSVFTGTLLELNKLCAKHSLMTNYLHFLSIRGRLIFTDSFNALKA